MPEFQNSSELTHESPGTPGPVASSVAGLRQAMTEGSLTATALTQHHLDRIAALDPALRAVISVCPDALEQAADSDAALRSGQPRGVLEGIPVLVKDNIQVSGSPTTAGSPALLAARAPDAFIIARLREAGAIVLAKANLSEWANFRSTRSSSGWSTLGGQTANPYALDRNPSGSSSGSAAGISAGFAPLAIGTETDGSIVSPANVNGVCGLKPTVGAVPGAGIVPISASQDSAGPLTRCVADLGLIAGVLAGRPEWADAARRPELIRGARLGVLRKGLTGRNQHTDRLFEDALRALADAGAELVDPVDLPTADQLKELHPEELVFKYEMKAGLAAYLARRPELAVRTIEDVIRFNQEHADQELRWFGQEELEESAAAGPLDDPVYVETRDRGRRLAGPEGIDRVLREHRLAALVAPSGSPAHVIDPANSESGFGSSTFAAIAGYPILSVPMGLALEALPLGLAFFAGAGSEPALLGLAAGFEREAPHFRVPAYRPTLGLP